MDDFKLVEAPVKKPWGCIVCRSQTGPVADTFVETHDGNLYICRYCAGLAAKAHGLVDGPLSQEQLSALDMLAAKDKEIDDLKRRAVKDGETKKTLRATVAAVEVERDEAQGQVAQFRHLLGHVAETIGDATLTPAA